MWLTVTGESNCSILLVFRRRAVVAYSVLLLQKLPVWSAFRISGYIVFMSRDVSAHSSRQKAHQMSGIVLRFWTRHTHTDDNIFISRICVEQRQWTPLMHSISVIYTTVSGPVHIDPTAYTHYIFVGQIQMKRKKTKKKNNKWAPMGRVFAWGFGEFNILRLTWNSFRTLRTGGHRTLATRHSITFAAFRIDMDRHRDGVPKKRSSHDRTAFP